MSYLGFPRLHFSGEFQADPSTVNNDPTHFNTTTFTPNDQSFGRGTANGWWNPSGSAYWRLRNCRVQSLYYRDGTYCSEPLVDTLIGMPLQGSRDRVSAKLVDLDSEQQMVSEIWGLQIRLGEFGEPNSFQSEFEVAAFFDIWARYPAGHPDSFFSAVYQSVLTGTQWSSTITSRFLQELASNNEYPTTLSIKFTVDGYDDDPNSPTFTWGRIVGAIGPYYEEEPKHFVNARLLRNVPNSPMNYAPCYLDTDKQLLFVDFSNSLPTTAAGGPLQDIGPLQMAILPSKGAPVLLGPINYLYRGFNDIKAGIQSFPLSPKQMNLAQKAPLAVVSMNGTKIVSTYLSENPAGAFARADQFVYRIDANTSQTVTLYATKFGCPEPNQSFDLVFENDIMQGQVRQATSIPAGPSVGIPESALQFPPHVTTNANGQVRFELKAGAPGNPRGYIDGQVYGVAYLWKGISPIDYNRNTQNILSVLVWDEYKLEALPTWIDNVQLIFQQYANLYPVMKNIVDLSDYESVLKHLRILQLVFDLEPRDPNYMPVTRDLSTPKRAMIQTWLKEQPQPLYRRISNVEELKNALQLAIELEHATIPTYLTALYSIKPGHNTEVAKIIRSVVMEEMLHMALACNLLNAIGGHPAINTPNFVPAYPTHLPGGLRPDLTVSLRKCSIEHIRDVFMSIEAPDEQIRANSHLTIGWFYGLIKEAFEDLSQSTKIFVGDRALQLDQWPHQEMIVVHDLDSACKAIDEIVEQGEGHTRKDPFDEQGDLGHYYRFAEIVHGRRLVEEPASKGYSYTGEKITFDENGVWPMIDDPDTQALDPSARARLLSDEFNEAYANVLNALHTTFNGKPENVQKAVGLMFSLSLLAEQLMQTPIHSGLEANAGPSFQYPQTKIS